MVGAAGGNGQRLLGVMGKEDGNEWEDDDDVGDGSAFYPGAMRKKKRLIQNVKITICPHVKKN